MKIVLDLFSVAVCKAACCNERVEGWPAVGRKSEKREMRIKQNKRQREKKVGACNLSLALNTRAQGGSVKDISKWSSVKTNITSIY